MTQRPPDLFLIGVPRSGTTSLYYGLRQHPRIFAPDQKESCYTCPDVDPGTRRNFTRWFDDRDEYLSLFSGARPDQIICEGCIYNVYSPQAPGRIRELNDDARFLIQLRDPLEQMYSNHALKVIMRDTPSDSFAEALAIQDRLRGDRPAWAEPPINFADYDMRDKATVSFGLARFIQEFGRDRLHVSLYEDFAQESARVLRSAFEFLGVDPDFVPRVGVMVPNRVARSAALNRAMGSQRVISVAKRIVPDPLHSLAGRAAAAGFRLNRRPTPREPMDHELRGRLRVDFRPEVEWLSELVGVDLAARWWS